VAVAVETSMDKKIPGLFEKGRGFIVAAND
jgi:hypothetical protein